VDANLGMVDLIKKNRADRQKPRKP